VQLVNEELEINPERHDITTSWVNLVAIGIWSRLQCKQTRWNCRTRKMPEKSSSVSCLARCCIVTSFLKFYLPRYYKIRC